MAKGPKPMDTPAEVMLRDGTIVAHVLCSIWQQSQSATAGGEAYDFAGMCTIEAAQHLVQKQNRVMKVDDDYYQVVQAHILADHTLNIAEKIVLIVGPIDNLAP